VSAIPIPDVIILDGGVPGLAPLLSELKLVLILQSLGPFSYAVSSYIDAFIASHIPGSLAYSSGMSEFMFDMPIVGKSFPNPWLPNPP